MLDVEWLANVELEAEEEDRRGALNLKVLRKLICTSSRVLKRVGARPHLLQKRVLRLQFVDLDGGIRLRASPTLRIRLSEIYFLHLI